VVARVLLSSTILKIEESPSPTSSSNGSSSSKTLVDKRLPHRPYSKNLPQLPIDRFDNGNRPPTLASYDSRLLEEQINKSRNLVHTKSTMIKDGLERDGTTFIPGKYPNQNLSYEQKRILALGKKGMTPSAIF
jgi:hypothetical protein